jgi:hypothetical protein
MVVPVLLASWLFAGAPESPPAPFGFRGMEIFRVSGESVALQAVDLNGDGLMDLVYADNEDATIRFLIQVKPEERKPEEPAPVARAQAAASVKPVSLARGSLNEVKSDDRFKVERFYTEKKVTALKVADLDGDRKPDLAYYGDPKELEIVYQGGEWGSRREKFAITDGLESLEALAAADLDGDGRTDLVLLGSGKTYLFRQRHEGGGLEKPQVLYNCFTDVAGLRVGDLDGDGQPDLLLIRPRASHPFLLRFQRQGSFGPEIGIKSLPVHEAYLADLDGSGRADLLCIQGNTRRVRALRWGKPKHPPSPPLSEPRLYAFRPESDPALRRVQLGDVNGDGRADLVVSSAETAELDIYLQDSRGELSLPSASPTLAEVKGIAIGDLDGDGLPEVAVVSAREKTLGISRWLAGGRLSIPETYGLEGEGFLVAAERLGGLPGSAAPGGPGAGGAPKDRAPLQLVIVFRGSDGKFHLSGRALEAGGKLATLFDLPFEAGAEPSGLALFDADGDGLTDCLVFIPFDDPRLFLREPATGQPVSGQAASGGAASAVPAEPFRFREVTHGKDFGLGQVAKLTPAAFSLGDLADPAVHKGPAMLIAQKSFARALVLDPAGRLKVVEQFAGRGGSAEISGAAALNLDQDPEKEVVLYDRAESALDILDRTPKSTYRLARTIPLPGLEFAGFRVLDMNGDGQEDLVVLGKQALAVLYHTSEDGELEEFTRYDLEDSSLERGKERGLPDHLAVGDLNGDGVRDLVFSTDPLQLLCILTPDGGKWGAGLHAGLTFPIFEEKAFMRRKAGHGPREVLAADVTGDGKTDLLLLIHDRILLYPQE